MIPEALALHLQERYPTLGFMDYIQRVANTYQISSECGVRIIIVGSRIMGTCGPPMELPVGYRPDIDLTDPGSLDKLYDWIEKCWKP